MPNPYLAEHAGMNDVYNMPPSEGEFSYQNQSSQSQNYQTENQFQQVDPNLPPPPNVYGQRTGMAEDAYHSQPFPQQFYDRNSTLSSAEIDEFENAKKQIKGAWKAGVAWFVLLGIIVGGMMILGMAMPSAGTNVNAGSVIMFMAVVFGIMAGFIALLTFGVYKKSLACVIILTVLMSLGTLNNLLSMEGPGRGIGGVLIGILFIYYFANGIKGISTYKKFVARFPHLNE
jgi:ABC-type multidrug transport system fused ATPase/permease subunit